MNIKKKNNVKICVALNSIRREKKISFEEEKKFIEEHAPCIDLKNNDSGYALAAKSKLVIFISSNLELEFYFKKSFRIIHERKFQKKMEK